MKSAKKDLYIYLLDVIILIRLSCFTMIWVIYFPWSNCEEETKQALIRAGLDARIYRWNEPENDLSKCDWYVLPGWFSFEDRWRSWIIASTYPIFNLLRKEWKKWKLIIGICNWAQMLVESWLITNSAWPRISLTYNKRPNWSWFYNDWCYLKPAESSIFNDFNQLAHMPFAHWEWRFIIPESEKKNIRVIFRYSDKFWNIGQQSNPNWSDDSIAGISNLEWNILAMMPHPERSESWALIFDSIKRHFNNVIPWAQISQRIKKSFEIELYIKLIISDNEAISLEKAFCEGNNINSVELERYRYIWISNLKDRNIFNKLLELWEFANLRKETVSYSAKRWVLVKNFENIQWTEIADIFKRFGVKDVEVETWIYWTAKDEYLDKIASSYIFANPQAQYIERN